MGSFDIKCKLSNTQIQSGDEVYLIPIRQSNFYHREHGEFCKPGLLIKEVYESAFIYTLEPILASYSDSGKYNIADYISLDFSSKRTLSLIRDILKLSDNVSFNDIYDIINDGIPDINDETYDQRLDYELKRLKRIYGEDFDYSKLSNLQIQFINETSFMAVHKYFFDNMIDMHSVRYYEDCVKTTKDSINFIHDNKVEYKEVSEKDISKYIDKLKLNNLYHIKDEMIDFIEFKSNNDKIDHNKLADRTVDKIILDNILIDFGSPFYAFMDHRYICSYDTFKKYQNMYSIFIDNSNTIGCNIYSSLDKDINNLKYATFTRNVNFLRSKRTFFDMDLLDDINSLKKNFTDEQNDLINGIITNFNSNAIYNISNKYHNNLTDIFYRSLVTSLLTYPETEITHSYITAHREELITHISTLFKYNGGVDINSSEIFLIIYQSLINLSHIYGDIIEFKKQKSKTKIALKELANLYTTDFENPDSWNYQVSVLFAVLILL